MTCVLDASDALSFVLADEFTDDSRRILDHVTQHRALVPSLWTYEVANGLRSALRRGRLTERAIAQASVALDRLPIEVVHEPPRFVELIAQATALGLSAHDAAYLILARERQLPLASRDGALVRAASAIGISLA